MWRSNDDQATAGMTGRNPVSTSALILFDGHCGICTRAVRWVQRRDPADRVPALPNQTPGLRERYGLTRADVDRTVWVIPEGGPPLAGAVAVNHVLAAVGGRGGRWFARLMRLPGLLPVEQWCYDAFARHRGWFARWGDVPACGRPGVDCRND